MKKLITLYGLILLGLTLHSCDALLDITPKSSITGQVFWQNEGDFYPYMTGIYNRYRSHIDYLGFSEDRSEMWKQGYNARFTPFWAHNIIPGNTVEWTGYYGTIGHVNLLLSRIEPFQFANTTMKNRIMAEAHAMRAAMYFYIARVYGDVPLVLDPVENENEPLYPRAPVSQVFQQINSDIEQALSLFPENGYPNKFRWTKPAVYALLADVKMWSASVLGGGVADYNAAIAAITEVENSGVSLLTEYGDIFDESRNNEIIMSFYLDRSEYSSGQYNNALLRFDTSQGADNASELPMALAGQQAYTLSDRALELFATHTNDLRIPRTYIPEIYNGVVANYWPNKFIGTQYTDTRIADSDIILYRLSDLLLLKAEAYAALGQSETALLNLNKVRARAGLPNFTEMDQSILLEEILDERGRELFHEFKRWYDLRRAHAIGVVDLYEYIPNLNGLNTPLYWPVHLNMIARNELLVQTDGY
ncbi:MAG: RagB/SusD family nutrient uptake outer membrane protein [Cyclobacteriaceae bacterium]